MRNLFVFMFVFCVCGYVLESVSVGETKRVLLSVPQPFQRTWLALSVYDTLKYGLTEDGEPLLEKKVVTDIDNLQALCRLGESTVHLVANESIVKYQVVEVLEERDLDQRLLSLCIFYDGADDGYRRVMAFSWQKSTLFLLQWFALRPESKGGTVEIARFIVRPGE